MTLRVCPDLTAPQRAEVAKCDLANAYRRLARRLEATAEALETTPLAALAVSPVPYVHRSTRHLEDALDAALTAL